MPRIFFDVVVDGNVTPDETGLELPDLKDMQWHALMAAAKIAREEVSQRKVRDVSVEVSDEEGVVMMIAHASLKVDWVI